MQRFVAVLVFSSVCFPLNAGDILPPPKLDLKSNYQAGVEEGDGAKKPKDRCEFLCDIFIVNTTHVNLKGMARATLHGFPGYVELDGICHHNGIVTIHPCRHPWHLWFNRIKVGVWDGEQTANVEFDFYGSCCKRRLIAEYDNKGRLQLLEK